MAERILQSKIRNFCIIAHIDHGKSTLADRMLELTHTIAKRKMREQVLDQMELERERGITIKLAPVRMLWHTQNQKSKIKNQNDKSKLINNKGESEFILNLIDTPGHVDFSYEVSRSLAAVEGVILLVDATQGIEAQTLSTLYSALEHDLTIVPVVNKIDLPAARPEEVSQEIVKLLGCREDEIIHASGKTGQGVEKILDTIIDRVPAPQGDPDGKLKALIFDSVYDPYRGVVAYIRIMSGKIASDDQILLMQTESQSRAEEIGIFSPKLIPHSPLSAGEIGYVVTGFRRVSEAAIGDTITLAKNPTNSPLAGYKKVTPYVFASIFAAESESYTDLKDAAEKLKLNDASLSFEPEHSEVLGPGLRCGFLGLLHLDIVRERLEREFNLDLVVTTPTVQYRVATSDGKEIIVERAAQMPEPNNCSEIKEPWASLGVIAPKEFVGAIMDLLQRKRAIYKNTEYFDDARAILKYEIPLSELIVDFYDQLKSISSGYASMNYEILDWRPAELSKIDILIAEEKVEPLSFIVYTPKARDEARRIVQRLRELIPRQNFEVKIQAVVSGTIIASERISPLRKDVTAKLYGGDVTRKNKLLDKQKRGKKKMQHLGRVNLPSDIFIKVLKTE